LSQKREAYVWVKKVTTALISSILALALTCKQWLLCLAVLEVSGDASISDAVHLLAENNIFSAPVKDPRASSSDPWSVQYIGIVDYASIILWVLEQAELAATAIATGSATVAGMGAGALGALGALVLGLTGPIAMAGVATVAVGAALAG
jgi:CBS domain-containing protein